MCAFCLRYVVCLFEKNSKNCFTVSCLAITLGAMFNGQCSRFRRINFCLCYSQPFIFFFKNDLYYTQSCSTERKRRPSTFQGRSSRRKEEENNIIAVFVWRERAREKAIVLHEKRILIVPTTTRNINNKSNRLRRAHAFAMAAKNFYRTSLSDWSRSKHMD